MHSDHDNVDLTNLQRQIIHRTATIGQRKVDSAAQAMAAINPDCGLVPLPTRLEGALLASEIALADVVLDCSDNFATRHAINRACIAAKKPLVSGAAVRFDGQIAVFDPRPRPARGHLPPDGCRLTLPAARGRRPHGSITANTTSPHGNSVSAPAWRPTKIPPPSATTAIL